jgi:polar amino acid transport system ATP-binding protein
MKLEIKNLSKSFNGIPVLKNLNFFKEDIKSLMVIGPSGGGKSTFLKILAGLLVPDEGEVKIDGNDLKFTEISLREHRKNTGVVFQGFNLFPHLSALENITLPLEKIHKISKIEAKQKALKLLKRFKLEEHSQKYPSQLSGGQQQRVAITRALALDSQLFLFDEPTSALDPYLVSEVLDTILELKNEGKNIVVVTHQLGFAQLAGDYLVFIDEGRIIEEGIPKEVLQNPKTKELEKFLKKTLKY